MDDPLHSKFKFSIIGSGNIAWHIARTLQQSGHFLEEVYSRNASTAKELAKICNGSYQQELNFKNSQAHLFFLAVPDGVIEEIVNKIQLPDHAILISLSGSFALKNLQSVWKNSAVFYPLQTFTKNRQIDFQEIPIFVEASNPNVLHTIKAVGLSISKKIIEADSSKREKIHVAAVFASNFTNYLLSVSHDILSKEEIDFEILQSLVTETVHKAFQTSPQEGQTGPASRGDHETIKRHLQLLDWDRNFQDLYKELSIRINNSKEIS